MNLPKRFLILSFATLYTPAFLCAGSGENAALSYHQAFALLPEKNEKLWENWPKVPKEETVEEIVSDAKEALWFFHRGAQRKECDWGIATEAGPFAPLPYYMNDYFRRIGMLVCLQARSRIRKNEVGAVQNIIDLLAFARHIGNEPCPKSKWTHMLVDRWAIQTTAAILPRLHSVQIRKLRKALESLPPARSAEEVFKNADQFIVRWLRENFVNCKQPEKRISNLRELYSEVCTSSWKKVEPGLQLLAQHRELFQKKLEAAVHLWKEERLLFENWTNKEKPEATRLRLYKRWSKNKIARAFSDPPYLRIRLWYGCDIEKVRFSLFRTALEVALHGKKSITGRTDPLMGKPFRYEKTKDGFILSSARFPPFPTGAKWWQLVLRVGKRAGIEKRLARTKAKLGADNEGAESEN